jgi:hypothetical protein
MTDSEYRRTLVRGALIGAAITILGLYMVKPSTSPNPPISTNVENHGNFEVVDKYKNCEVVRWTNGQLANYQFFLNCPK